MNTTTINLISANTLDNAPLASLLNQIYEDYYVSVLLTESQFAAMCFEEDIDLANSVIAQAGNQPVGTALLSRRSTRGWISGVGVLPGWRRKGIAHRMVEQIQARAVALGMEQLTLEALAQNEAGLALYDQLGFVKRRELAVLTMPPTGDLLTSGANGNGAGASSPHITLLDPDAALDLADALHDSPPPWQRESTSLRHTLENEASSRTMAAFGYQEAGEWVGYVLFSPQRQNQVVLDLAVSPRHPRRLEIGRALLQAMHQTRPAAGGFIINVPTTDALYPVFIESGYRVWQTQHEMIWTPSTAES